MCANAGTHACWLQRTDCTRPTQQIGGSTSERRDVPTLHTRNHHSTPCSCPSATGRLGGNQPRQSTSMADCYPSLNRPHLGHASLGNRPSVNLLGDLLLEWKRGVRPLQLTSSLPAVILGPLKRHRHSVAHDLAEVLGKLLGPLAPLLPSLASAPALAPTRAHWRRRRRRRHRLRRHRQGRGCERSRRQSQPGWPSRSSGGAGAQARL